MKKGLYRGTKSSFYKGLNSGIGKGVMRGVYDGFSPNTLNLPYVQDFEYATWSRHAFNFDGADNIFTGDSTISTAINNAIVGATAKFTIWFWVKRNNTTPTQIIWCRDNSSTSVRQFSSFFNSANKMQIQFWDTNSANNIVWTSTNTYTEIREWDLWVAVLNMEQTGAAKFEGVYRNPVTGQVATAEAGSAAMNGTFNSVNNTSANNVTIGGRASASNFANIRVNQLGIINTNLTASQVGIIHNNRVPLDVRTNTTIGANVVLFLSADNNSSFSSSWTWPDLVSGGSFTSAGMGADDLLFDAPALKQVSVFGMYGQSNLVSRVSMQQLLAKFVGILNWNKVWNSTTFVNINSITNNNQYIETNQKQFGAEYYLGDYLNQKLRKTILIHKVALGGTSLAYQGNGANWRYPDADQGLGGQMYQQLHNTDIPNLKEWELANGMTITKYAFIWFQGEADAQVQADADNYDVNTTALLTHASYGMFILWKQKFYFQPYFYDCLLSPYETIATLTYRDTVNQKKRDHQATNTSFYRIVDTYNAGTFGGTVGVYVHINNEGQYNWAQTAGALIVQDGF